MKLTHPNTTLAAPYCPTVSILRLGRSGRFLVVDALDPDGATVAGGAGSKKKGGGALREEIDRTVSEIARDVGSKVYGVHMAKTQRVFETKSAEFFEALDRLEERLQKNSRGGGGGGWMLPGETPTVLDLVLARLAADDVGDEWIANADLIVLRPMIIRKHRGSTASNATK